MSIPLPITPEKQRICCTLQHIYSISTLFLVVLWVWVCVMSDTSSLKNALRCSNVLWSNVFEHVSACFWWGAANLRKPCHHRPEPAGCSNFTWNTNSIGLALAVFDLPLDGQCVVPIRNHKYGKKTPRAVAVRISRTSR